jgi:hypothetical protein
MLKLESPRESRLLRSILEKENSSAYDCLAIYKHADMSYDWLPCKIVHRRLKKELAQLMKQNISFNQQCFEYQVAFLHLSKKQDVYTTSKNVFPRSSEEILFSANYTRELQRTFKQQCLDYIRRTYKESSDSNYKTDALSAIGGKNTGTKSIIN